MKKTLLYLLILAFLGFGVWYFLFSERSGQLFRSSDAGFTIRDTAAISKIFIAPNDAKETITLERKPNGWIVNNTYPVLKSTLRQLLNTLYFQEAAYPVPDNQRETMLRGLVGAGIKVEVYNNSAEKMRVFYVGGELNKFAGTVMLMEGSETPYVVRIPGFEGYLTTRYTADLGMWRDRLVFDLMPDQIEQVSVRYINEPLNSFTILQQNGKVSVTLDSSLHLNTPLNEHRVESYLTFFNKVYNESYVNGIPQLDSIVGSMPTKAVIDLKGKNGYHQQATIIYYPLTSRSKNLEGQPTTTDQRFNTDRYFAVINDAKDTATVQTHTFERFFRRGYEFFQADPIPQGAANLPGGANNPSK